MALSGPLASQTGKKTKFSRLAWGLEMYELLSVAIDLLYEPELQVRAPLRRHRPALRARASGTSSSPSPSTCSTSPSSRLSRTHTQFT